MYCIQHPTLSSQSSLFLSYLMFIFYCAFINGIHLYSYSHLLQFHNIPMHNYIILLSGRCWARSPQNPHPPLYDSLCGTPRATRAQREGVAPEGTQRDHHKQRGPRPSPSHGIAHAAKCAAQGPLDYGICFGYPSAPDKVMMTYTVPEYIDGRPHIFRCHIPRLGI